MSVADKLAITPEMLDLVARLDEFKGSWRAVGALPRRQLQDLKERAYADDILAAVRFSRLSITERKVHKIVSSRSSFEPVSPSERLADAYRACTARLEEGCLSMDLNVDSICELHRILMAPVAGEGEGEVGTCVSEVLEGSLAALCQWSAETLRHRSLHPLLVVSIFCASFVAMHPFKDGNDLLACLLQRWLHLKNGYAFVAYAPLTAMLLAECPAFSAPRDGLTPIQILRREMQLSSANPTEEPNWQPWILFYFNVLTKAAGILKDRLEREEDLFASQPELSMQILVQARARGRVTLRDMVESTGVSRNTLKEHFKSLVDEGRLAMHGKGRGVWYSLA